MTQVDEQEALHAEHDHDDEDRDAPGLEGELSVNEAEKESRKPRGARVFHAVRARGENPLDSGLTELNAAKAVDKGMTSHSDWVGHAARYGHELKWLSRGKIKTLLDVGAGNLQLPYYMWRNRAAAIDSYWGLELRAQEAWLDDVGWRTPLTLVRADIVLDQDKIEALPGWPGQFDAISFTEVLEHIPREHGPGMFDWMYKVLKPGGVLFFSTPNAGVTETTAANHLDAHGVSREWTFDAKTKLVTNAGFEIEDVFGVFCGLTRIPKEAQKDPIVSAAHKFLHNAWYVVLIAAAFPRESNNCMYVLRKPR